MDPKTKTEIQDAMKLHRFTLEDIETDIDTRDNYPGEFYLMSLMHVATDDLRQFVKEARA